VLFASDVAVWNIAIQNSSATQASLLVNLAPLWVDYLYVFLNTKPATNFGLERQLHYLEWLCWSVLNFS
jgi:drug/metabolite transporter (DMT)-like permease